MANISTKASYGANKISMSGGNLTPRIISTFFLLALQQYFLSNQEYPWSKNDNETEIDIHPDYEEDDNLEKSIPVVIVQNGPVSILPSGIGTGMTYMAPRVFKMGKSSEILDAILDSNLQLVVNSNILLTITGMSTDDISELSFEIGVFLQMLKYNAASILQLQSLGDPQISPVQATSKVGWSNRYTTQISIPYSFTIARVWKPTNYGQLLKSVILNLEETVMGSKSNKKIIVPSSRMYQVRDTIPEREELSKEPIKTEAALSV